MDFIIYTLVTIIVWALSVSFLLPFVMFLKFNKTYRDKWFSWFFVKVIVSKYEHVMAEVRKRAFDLLKEHLEGRKRTIPLEILETGIGGGSNLQFYPDNSNLTVLDMNESFLKYFKENKRKYPQVTYKTTVIGTAEDMQDIDDDSFDVVVSTYVLCSVKNVPSVLKEVKRVLKPGGKFLFVMHTAHPSFTWEALMQHLINPIWKIAFNGCSLIKKDDEEIRKSDFLDVLTEECYLKDLWLYVRPHVIGIATK